MPTHYFRSCSPAETLSFVVGEAMRNGATVQHKQGAGYVISSKPLAGYQQVAPIFSPIRHLEQSA
jgi:hypothetical protein